MAQTISNQKTTNKFQKTVGGSMTSLFTPGNRTFFRLEHKTTTEKHKMGESTPFMSDYVELGRGNKYALNYGEDCQNVSRPHASISRKEQNWVLTPISQTNGTYLNNQKISAETPLSNGDDIQLSSTGPKVSFLIPTNNKVSGTNFTVRMKAFANEAMRPYKTALTSVGLLLVLVAGGSTFWIKSLGTEVDSQQVQIAAINKQKEELDKKIQALQLRKPEIRTVIKQVVKPESQFPYDKFSANTFYIETSKVSYEIDGVTKEKEYTISGTGFLLADGSFVTARHVVEPWFFSTEEIDKLLNILSTAGIKVKMRMLAVSPDGRRIEFTNESFKTDKSDDEKKDIEIDGKTYKLSFGKLRNGSDWAVAKTSQSGGLPFDKSLSTRLSAGTQLHVLGYSFGIGANNINNIKAPYSRCDVAISGLDKGVIDISSRSFDSGNSGGPVFAKDSKGDFVVIGIVSAGRENQGVVVPISAIGN